MDNMEVFGALEVLHIIEEAELTKKEIAILENILQRYEFIALRGIFRIDKFLMAKDLDCSVSEVEKALSKMTEADWLTIEEDGSYCISPYGYRPYRTREDLERIYREAEENNH
jgi:hypothetical protein|tara:strand:+ start:1588 stop:1926 length:339 start_codon:yes stop_codon:yes gene_type:complete